MGARYSSLIVLCLGAAAAGCGSLEKAVEGFKLHASKTVHKSPAKDPREPLDHSLALGAFVKKKQIPPAPDNLAWARYYHGQAGQPGIDIAKHTELLEKARDAYLETLICDKNHLDALCGLGTVLSELGEHEQALTVYDRALKKFPNDPLAHCGFAACQGRRNDWEAAVVSLKTAVKLAPEKQECQQMLAHALVRARHVAEGSELLAKVMKSADANYRVAQALHEDRQFQKCAHYLYLALAADPRHEPASTLLQQLKQVPKSAGDVDARATLDFEAGVDSPCGETRGASGPEIYPSDQDRIVFHHGIAERIRKSWEEGKGWCIVTGLQNLEVMPGAGPTQHVKYRLASSATFTGTINDPHVELFFGPESSWLVVHVNDEINMPVQSGPANAVIEKANLAQRDLESLRYQVLAQISSDGVSQQKRTELRQTFLPIVERQIISLRSLIEKSPAAGR